MTIFSERDPSAIKWKDCGVEYVAECIGVFEEVDKSHIEGEAQRVLIDAPSKSAPMFVMGVNHEECKQEMRIISNASCTTNWLAPIAKVLDDSFGIEEWLMTTMHAATANQLSADGPTKKKGAWRIGRAYNIIPATTVAAAIGKVIPALNKKLNVMACRVPVVDRSVVDLTVKLNEDGAYECYGFLF